MVVYNPKIGSLVQTEFYCVSLRCTREELQTKCKTTALSLVRIVLNCQYSLQNYYTDNYS